MRTNSYDVVVVGGGPAGLGAAVALSRVRRSVLVVDSGVPRNATSGHVHNYLGREGISPADLLAEGRAAVAGYGGEVVSGTVIEARAIADTHARRGIGFRVGMADGSQVDARRLLVAIGLVDELPDLPGLGQRWGRDVVHCPFCHGWEARDQPIGVLGTGPFVVHQASMFRQLSEDTTVFLHTAPPLNADQKEQLAARGVRVVEGKVAGLEVSDDRLTGVRMRSGEVVPSRLLAVTPRYTVRIDTIDRLGLTAVVQEMGGMELGTVAAAGPGGATTVPGMWVAGNAGDVRAQVISSAAGGLDTAAAINGDLVTEDIGLAVAAHRATVPADIA